MAVKTFRDIVAWQKAHQLTLNVYRITDGFPREEMFGLTSQMRRCAVSIASNLAEGFKRKTKNDSLRFYNIAEGSLEELKYQMVLAKDLKYIPPFVYKEVEILAEEVGRLINGWSKVQR